MHDAYVSMYYYFLNFLFLANVMVTFSQNSTPQPVNILSRLKKNCFYLQKMQLVSNLLGWLIRSYVFETDNGNDDWALLGDPANYNLTGATNIYLTGFPVRTVSTLGTVQA
jgi:hypothetical protein